MKKLLGILGGLVLTFAFVTVTSAAGSGKAPLYNSPSYTPGLTCPNGADSTSGPTFGFVVMNINQNGDLIIEVSLKGADPNAIYDIWVNQDPGACPLGVANYPGVLTTNRNGNGNAHIKLPTVPGAANFWVSALDGNQVLRSSALKLTEWTFTANDSLYYNCPIVCGSIYGSGPISFSWDPHTGNVTSGYYNEIVPPTTGTTYYNVVSSGSVVGGVVNLTFTRTNPNIYGPFTFTGTLVGNVLTGYLDGPYYFTATGN